MNDNFVKIQNQIRENSQTTNDYVKGLYQWQNDMNKKMPHKVQKNRQPVSDIPPIRNSAFKAEQWQKIQTQIFQEKDIKLTKEQQASFKRDVTPMPKYYKNWDNFDVDKQLEKLDDEEQKKKSKIDQDVPRTKEDFLKRTKGAKPNTQILIKGGKRKVDTLDDLKRQGNSYFTSLEFQKAASCYSRVIQQARKEFQQKGDKVVELTKQQQDFMAVVYSNRSQCFLNLRKYQKAQSDGSMALRLDYNHVKSLNRRGQARSHLNKFEEALDDLNRAIELDPENTKLVEELKKLLKKIDNKKKEVLEGMNKPIPDTFLTGQSGLLVEVDQLNLPEKIRLEQEEKKKKRKIQQIDGKNEQIKRKQQAVKRQERNKKGLEAFLSDDDDDDNDNDDDQYELAADQIKDNGTQKDDLAEWTENNLKKSKVPITKTVAKRKHQQNKQIAEKIVKAKMKPAESASQFERDLMTFSIPQENDLACKYIRQMKNRESIIKGIELPAII